MKKILCVLFASILIYFFTNMITNQLIKNTTRKVENLNSKNLEMYRKNFNEKLYPEILFFDDHKNEIKEYDQKEKYFCLLEIKKVLSIIHSFNQSTPRIYDAKIPFLIYQTEDMEKLKDIYNKAFNEAGRYDTFIYGDSIPGYMGFKLQVEDNKENNSDYVYKNFIDRMKEMHEILNKKNTVEN